MGVYALDVDKPIDEGGNMADQVQNQLIADIARDLIAQTAPQELPLFRATSTAYFKHPNQMLRGISGQKEEMLGFGVEIAGAVTFVSPIALAVVDEVIKFIAGEIKDSDFIKNVFRKFRPSQAEVSSLPLPLTSEQRRQVRKVAFEKARQLGLSELQANLLADSMIGELVTLD
jgi:hypothetical protein